MNILAIGSHPDDIEFGCGGAVIKYARKGHHVFLMVMTEGSQGGDPGVRRAEQERAAAIMGARKVLWGDYRDTEIPPGRPLVQRLEEAVRLVAPDFIFVHHSDDTHQDHQNLAGATLSATRYTRNVLCYEGPTTQNFSPSVFVDIARSMAHFRGIQGRHRNAEGFIPVRLFINIGT